MSLAGEHLSKLGQQRTWLTRRRILKLEDFKILPSGKPGMSTPKLAFAGTMEPKVGAELTTNGPPESGGESVFSCA
jgi:hypothetical protein